MLVFVQCSDGTSSSHTNSSPSAHDSSEISSCSNEGKFICSSFKGKVLQQDPEVFAIFD